MHHLDSSRSRSALISAAVLLPILASLVLAACGSTTSTSTSTTTAADKSAAKTAAAGPAGARKRFEGMRECLQKSGVVLPKQGPGQGPSVGGGLLGGAAQLPKGVTPAQYRAAIKKCVGSLPGVKRVGGGGSRVKSPVFKQALAKFAACLRANGIKFPAPNTSGKGPIFDTKGLNIAGPKFKAAQTKCAGIMRSAFKASPGAAAG